MKRLILAVLAILLVCTGVVIGLSLTRDTGDTAKSGGMSNTSNSSTALDLSNQGITSISSSVYSKTNTTTLILSSNTLTSLPSEMGRMTKLEVLKLDHNALEGSLIGEIRQMTKLRELDASYNNMTGVPAEIGQLKQLEVLNLSHNNLTQLPNELANLSSNLKTFDLTGNPISSQTMSKLRTELPNTTIIF